MPIFTGNPNAFPPWPPPQYGQFPGGNWLMRNWGNAMQHSPWAVPEGMQAVPHQFPQVPGAQPGLLQQVADIYSFPKKGLLGVPGTEGAGGRGLGSRGGGMLGSQWRDPRFIQNYEVQQGLKPGSIKPPSADVTTIAPKGPQRDFGKYNAKVTDPRMLTPEARREATMDAAQRRAEMQIDAEIAKRIAQRQQAGTQYTLKPGPVDLEKVTAMRRQIAKEQGLDPRTGEPTTAQMARPVRQTPEISAKLAEARVKRAASEGYRLVEDARAWMSANKGKKPFDSKVLSDRYNKMDVDQQMIFSRIMFPEEFR